MVIVISMETAQQQAGRRRPIQARSGSRVSSNGRWSWGGVGGCAGGLCGPVKVNAQGGVIRSAHFLVGLRISACWCGRETSVKCRASVWWWEKYIYTKDKLTFELWLYLCDKSYSTHQFKDAVQSGSDHITGKPSAKDYGTCCTHWLIFRWSS